MNINNHSYDADYNVLIQTDNYKSLKVKSGHLVQKTIFDKFIEFFSKKRAQSNDDRLKRKIVSILKQIKSLDDDSLAKTANILKKINTFRDSQLVFDLKGKYKILSEEIEHALSPALQAARDNKKDAENLSDLQFYKQAIRVEKTKLALSLGVSFEENTGATGTVKARNLKGRVFAVFKPIHRHTPILTKIKNFFKRYGGQLAYLSKRHDAQSKAEVAAFRLDKHFGFNITPHTSYESLEGKEGAFQHFLKGEDLVNGESYTYKMFSDINTDPAKFAISSDELSAFQKMAIFDYLIGNLDRHEENWFIRELKTGEKDFRDIKVIDNANAFLAKNPRYAGLINNQYKWKELNPSKEPLRQETLDFILKNLTEEKMDEFIKELKKTPQFSDFLEMSMEGNLRNRLNVLRNFAENYPHKTLEDLANIVSNDDFKKNLPDLLE